MQETRHKTLVDANTCIEKVFEGDRPSIRTFQKWKQMGLIPYHKIGKRVFFDPIQVRAALDKQFLIQVKEGL